LETIYRWGGQAIRVDLARIKEEVRRYERAHWTRKKLARHCKVSVLTLRRFLAGQPVSPRTVHAILSSLSFEADEVLTYLPEVA
jgi:hypothetical protein